MAELHEILAERVAGWRASGYAHAAHPAIAEILSTATRPTTTSSGIMLGEEVLVALDRGGATD